MHRCFTSFLILLFFSAAATLSAPPIQFDRIPSELGLSQNLISAILQDRKGFLWFGTKDGLNRFDGYKFTVYRHDPFDSTSLSDSYITALLEDRAGRIWVGTFSGGLNLFDREREIFHHSLPDADNPNSLSHARISALAEDSRQDGTIWIGTLGGGVNKLVPSTGSGQALSTSSRQGLREAEGLAGAGFTRFVHEPNNPNSLGDNVVLKLAVDQKNVIWVATFRAIDQIMPIDSARHTITRFGSALPNAAWKKCWEKDQDESAYTMVAGPQGKIWIGSALGFISWNAAASAYTFYEPMAELPWGQAPSCGKIAPARCGAAARMDYGALIWRRARTGIFGMIPTTQAAFRRAASSQFMRTTAACCGLARMATACTSMIPKRRPSAGRQAAREKSRSGAARAFARSAKLRTARFGSPPREAVCFA